MLGNEVEGSVLGVRLAHQDGAIAQTCVPLVAINGPSYRMRRHHERLEQLRSGLTT